ncbi:hypothetical protein TYRP_021226 [Tyrophagus putrescentiae]|nr:hypothetical protein TYRP_021226 [Tyrophagus putrescentiae]
MKLSSFYHCLVLALIFGFIFGSFLAGTDGASRQPNSRDHIHCKMEYHEQWEDVMQTADPYAVVESYYDLHGDPCTTPCRLRSPNNPALTVTLPAKPSPDYEQCGQGNKFCFKGTCVSKRMS